MKFQISEEIFNLFPDLRIGVVVGKGLDIKKERPQKLQQIIDENSQLFCKKVGDNNLSDFVNIKVWRETYKKFGVSPNKYKPTAEALLKRILNGNPLPNINTAVDAYLAVELLYMLPIGGYDLSNVNGDIKLRISGGGELFRPIGSENDETTNNGEIVYSDDAMILTRNWNYRDCDAAKIAENSRDIILACEASMNNISDDDLKNSINKIVEYQSLCCQGHYQTFFLDSKISEVSF